MTAISEAERARRQSEHEQRRAAEAEPASECASLRAELKALRVELTERRHADLTAIRETLAERIGEVIDQVEMVNKRLQTELWNLVKSQLGALQARADEVSELPDPLPPRRAIN